MPVKAADFIKKKGTTDGKSNKLDKGGRSQQMKDKGMSGALIAWIGDRKHGKGKMEKWSKEGRARDGKK